MKILMSIHNEHINNIKSGNKKFDFRKVEAKRLDEYEIFFYATAPISKVVGFAKIYKVHIDTPKNIWKIAEKYSGINRTFFDEYYKNKSKAIAYEIKHYQDFDSPKDLSEFGIYSAPQSFVYIK